ncbi:MAG: cell division protein FtsX [Candidatus Moduliflexus flocculans]|nr:cell division protein FtsX [Candidatus Moduliflexus flocculans]
MAFTWNGDQGPWLNLRISSIGVSETIQFLETTWKAFVPEFNFAYEFLDDKYDSFYKQDRRTRSILGVFTVLALFTACLGLVGLASYVAEKRTKEIGIRKVLGASSGSLVLMQSREFLGWVLVANAITLPAAYFAAGRWLRGFAYRVDPGVAPAFLAVVFSAAVAFLSVAYKAVQTARANPIDALKYE